MDKKIYYVTVEDGDIREIAVAGSGIEYEIEATVDDVMVLEGLFNDQKDKAVDFVTKIHKEKSIDVDRETYDTKMMQIYDLIYRLGTPKTKEDIENLGVLKK